NYKRGEMQALEENGNRATAYVDAFINGVDWKRSVEELDRLSKVTKADVVAWANEKLDPEVYAAVYKRQGVDPNIHKIDKPQITPIATNRDKSSEFLAAIQAAEVEAVQPVFVDYASDLSVGKMKQDIEVLYKQNTTNGLFSLYYVYDFGTTTDPAFGIASDYFDLLGTDTQSLQEIQREFYDLACSFGIHAGGERIYVTISGLAENMDKAVKLAEEYMQNVEGDDAVLAQLKANAMKARNDAKLNQNANFRALQQYTFYGPEAIRARTLTDEQLMALTSDELLARIRSLSDYEHYVMYYGPETEAKLIAALDAIHRTSQELKPVRKVRFPLLTVDKSEVNVAQYDAKQIYYLQYSNRGEKFSTDNDPGETLFNSYFGGGMNAVVFQEMREARSLAYTAFATFTEMRDKDDPYIFYAFIATQNDKMRQAVEAFDEIIENMPESEKAFELAKQGILANLSTQRTVRDNVLWSFVSAREMGVGVDRNKAVYDAVQGMTLADVKAFHDKWVKGRKYTYSILGDRNDIDMDYLRTLGPVHEVSQRELFGY
ncbi:MAG: insulinase family protein, partial [Alistipes communis]